MKNSNSNSGGNTRGATPTVAVRKMPFVRPAWADEVERPALAERPGVFHTGRTHRVLDGHELAVWSRVGEEPTNPDE